MNITLSEMIVVAAAVLTIVNLIDKILGWRRQAKQPAEERIRDIESRLIQIDQRISDHDRSFEIHAGFFDNDKRRLDLLEKGSRVTSKALLALLGHANGGSNAEEMQEAEKTLRRYLIER